MTKYTKAFLCLLLLAIVGAVAYSYWSKNIKKDGQMENRKAEIILRMGYSQATDNPRHVSALAMQKWVYEQTNHRVWIELYPNEVLGTTKEMTEMAIVGNMDMVITTHGILSEYEPKVALLALPFLFSGPEKVVTVLEGPLGNELAKDLPKHGLRLLAYWDNGFRQITNNKHPIGAPTDMIGLKFRVPEDRMSLSTYKAMGSNPIPLPFPELYIALSKGEIDGEENTLVNIKTAKLYEVQKYLTIINCRYQVTPLIISERTWRKLPPDVQKVLQEGANQVLAEHRRQIYELDSRIVVELEQKGMKIVYPEAEAFRQATTPVYEEWAGIAGKELVDRIVSEAR